ncbi:hypothetical protein BJ546DRAFT_964253 [Cryomyces antarcticus]
MHTRPLTASGQALYRVFVRPELSVSPIRINTKLSPPPQPCQRQPIPHSHGRAFSHTPRLGFKVRAPVNRTQLYDEEIASQIVLVVDEAGKLQPPQTRFDVLRSFDRKTHHLVQVSPLSPSGDPPTCKILAKQSLREAERAKQKALTKKTPEQTTKQLELNWAIDSNDLGHRMKRMKEFLEQGKRVEVVLAGKRQGRKASLTEAQEIVRAIRERAEEVEGVKEWRKMDGQVGAMATLFFEGKRKST